MDNNININNNTQKYRIKIPWARIYEKEEDMGFFKAGHILSKMVDCTFIDLVIKKRKKEKNNRQYWDIYLEAEGTREKLIILSLVLSTHICTLTKDIYNLNKESNYKITKNMVDKKIQNATTKKVKML